MKSNRQILTELLSDTKIKKILIAENHVEHTPKDLLLYNIDLLCNSTVTKGRRVKILLEHFPVKSIDAVKQLFNLLPKMTNEMKQQLNFSSQVQPIDILDSILEKKFSTIYSLYPGAGQKILDLIKTAIYYDIEIDGIENFYSGYSSSIIGSYQQRIKQGNLAAASEIKQCVDTSSNYIIILLMGAAHVSNYLDVDGVKKLVNLNNDTISWRVKDCALDEDEKETNNAQETITPLLKLEFDTLTTKVPINEMARIQKEGGESLIPVMKCQKESQEILPEFESKNNRF